MSLPYTEHPYVALNANLDELQACHEAIEQAKQQLRDTQQKQSDIIEAALRKAHRDGDLKSLAQYLYLDAPKGVWRDHVKTIVGFLVGKNVQRWLCAGYTYEMNCMRCGKEFPYQVTSFSDLHEVSKPLSEHAKHSYAVRVGRQCPPCKQSWHADSARAFHQREVEAAALVQQLRAMPYQAYLQTEHWQSVRATALRRAKFRCQLCNASGSLHVHHRSYEHRGEEQHYMHDVIVLCRRCHEKHHDINRQ